MYCKNCNKSFGEEYVVCPECGEILRKENEINDTILEENTRVVNNTPHNGGPIIENKSTKYLVLSILMLLCCNHMCGIVALIFAIIGNSSYNKGFYDDAASKWKACKITLWIGVILYIVIFIATFVITSAGIVGTMENLVSV